MKPKLLIATVLLGSLIPVLDVSAAPMAKLGDWIAESCPKGSDIQMFAGFDLVSAKAVEDSIASAEYRDAVSVALAYIECHEKAGVGEFTNAFDERKALMARVACNLPSLVFMAERKTDKDLAIASANACKAAMGDLDDENRILDAKEVFNFALLVLHVDGVQSALKVLPGHLKDVTDADAPDADEMAGLQMLRIVLAIAAGDSETALLAVGGADGVCGWLGPYGIPADENGLRKINEALLNVLDVVDFKVTPDKLALLAGAFGDVANEGCPGKEMIGLIAHALVDEKVVDSAIKGAGFDALVSFYKGFPSELARMKGTAGGKRTIVNAVISQAEKRDYERFGKLECLAGDVEAENGDYVAALRHYDSSAILLSGPMRLCAVRGRLVAKFALGHKAEDLTLAVRDFLESIVDPTQINRVISDQQSDQDRSKLLKLLVKTSQAISLAVQNAMGLALLAEVDKGAGTEVAENALGVAREYGLIYGNENEALRQIVEIRHDIAMGRRKGMESRIGAVVAGMNESEEWRIEGVVSLVKWLSRVGEFGLVERALAKSLNRIGAEHLVEIAIEVGRKGKSKFAMNALLMAEKDAGTSVMKMVVAQGYAALGDYKSAERLLNTVDDAERDTLTGLRVLGEISAARRDYDNAIKAFGRAVYLTRRNDCSAMYSRGLTRMLMADPVRAEADFRQCVTIGADSPVVQTAIAYALFDQGKYGQTREIFENVAKSNNASADNMLGLALARFRDGDLPGAGQAYSDAIKAEPLVAKGAAAVKARGMIYSEIHQQAWVEMINAMKKVKQSRRKF